MAIWQLWPLSHVTVSFSTLRIYNKALLSLGTRQPHTAITLKSEIFWKRNSIINFEYKERLLTCPLARLLSCKAYASFSCEEATFWSACFVLVCLSLPSDPHLDACLCSELGSGSALFDGHSRYARICDGCSCVTWCEGGTCTGRWHVEVCVPVMLHTAELVTMFPAARRNGW